MRITQPSRRRRRAPGALCGALTVAWLILAAGASADDAGPRTICANTEPISSLAAADAIVSAFAAAPRRLDGNIVDPIRGMGAAPYSQATLASAALRVGRITERASLVAFGEHLLGWISARGHTGHPSVFEIAAVVDAFSLLPASSAVHGAVQRWLAGAPVPRWLRDRSTPYQRNKQIVEAYALAAIAAGRIRPDGPALRDVSTEFLTGPFRQAVTAYSTPGPSGAFTVLSDPPENPIAYHHLVLGFLARTTAITPSATTRRLLVRLARGTVAIAAPDGDAAYSGRSQEQAWSLPLAAYGLRVAAGAASAADAEEFRRLADVLLARYARCHAGGAFGLRITPGATIDAVGAADALDRYADPASSMGLTAMALSWLAELGSPPPPRPVFQRREAVFPLGEGAFATVERRDVWFAVRAHRSRAGDPRYDFGLAAAKTRTSEGWKDIVAPRPRPRAVRDVEPIGPALITGGRIGFPDGRRLRRDAHGRILVRGGWWDRRGRLMRRAVFAFATAHRRGVQMSFRVRRGDKVMMSSFPTDLAPRFLMRAGPLAASVRHEVGDRYASTLGLTVARARFIVEATRPGTLNVLVCPL